MLNFQRIINQFLETPKAQFQAGYCLHARHQAHDCRVCVDNCPSKALVMEERVRFNTDQCLGCGVCTANCITGAFVLESPTSRMLLEQSQGRKVLSITCCKGDKLPGILNIPCLGYLDSQVLGAMALQGTKVHLDISQERCAGCGGNGADLALAALDKANKLIQFLEEEENAGVIGQVTKEDAEVISRDEFLIMCRQKLGRGLKKSVTAIWEMEKSTEPSQESGVVNNLGVPRKIVLPEPRRLLLEALSLKGYRKGVKLVASDQLPFGSLAITDDCTGCGDCTVFCPTGALRKTVQDGNITITHCPAHCLKCELCALGCQLKVIKYLKTVKLSQVLASEEIIVFQLRVKRCTECNGEITFQSEHELCNDCLTKLEIELELDKVFADKSS